ncbi:hypothetical protein [Pseudalkalibacillus decolorationis]|nr:hypothetical protein [Pseudalkalibacillus decolorationis]
MDGVKNLETTLKNPSGYRERYVEKVDNGTGDILLITFMGK